MPPAERATAKIIAELDIDRHIIPKFDQPFRDAVLMEWKIGLPRTFEGLHVMSVILLDG